MSIEWNGWNGRAWGYSPAMRILFVGPVTVYFKFDMRRIEVAS